MQNIVNNYINNKIVNIKSETLFREAEDDFFYFNNLNSAAKKLKKAIELTPCHLKSILLYADICFVKGNFSKALSLYLIANGLKPNDYKILASVANSFFSMKKADIALKYCNEALLYVSDIDVVLYSQIIELKISILSELKCYQEAYITFTHYKNILKTTTADSICNALNEKLQLYKKLKVSGLKII